MNRTDKFVLILIVFVGLFVEDKVSSLLNYHWSLSILIAIPVVVILMAIYNKTKQDDNNES